MDSVLPRPIREELQKSMGFVQRDAPEKAITCLLLTLRAVRTSSVHVQRLAAPRIKAVLAAFVQLPRVRVLLEGTDGRIPYAVGKERVLSVVLEGFLEILCDQGRVAKEAEAAEQGKARQEHLYARGKNALVSGNTSLACAFFDRLLAEFPTDPTFCCEAGQALWDARLSRAAVTFLTKVVDVHQNYAPAYRALLDILLALEDYVSAEKVILRAIRIFGEHPTSLLRLAYVYEMWGKTEQALEEVTHALARDPTLEEAKAMRKRLTEH